MGLRLVTPATAVPVTVAELRKQIEWPADDSTHDAHLARLAADAAELVERFTRRSMVTQSWRFTTSWRRIVELPRPPLASIETVTLVDDENAETVVSSSDYAVLTNSFPGVLRFSRDYSPSVSFREYEPLQIDFTTGYGGATAVPTPMREAILQLVLFHFEPGRGDVQMKMPDHIKDRLRGMSSGMKAGFFSGVV